MTASNSYTPVSQLRLTFESTRKRCIEESHIATEVPALLATEGQPTHVEMFYSSEDRDAVQRLTTKGKAAGINSIKWIPGAETGSDEIEVFESRASFTIDTLVARAIAKIAFEYFVWNVGDRFPTLVRDELLAPIRDLVIHGTGDWRQLVMPTNGPILADETQTVRHGGCHLLSMTWESRGVVVRVALFNDIVYQVKVCSPPSAVIVDLNVGHHFDLEAKTVSRLATSNWIVAPPRVSRIIRPLR